MPTHYRGSEKERRALNAYINLVRAADSVMARLNTHLEANGLTVGQFGVLEALLHLGPMYQVALGEKLLRSGGNITTVLNNLERQKLVRRERQKEDKRKVLVSLTAEGKRRIADFFPRHLDRIAGEMSRLGAREQEELRRLGRKLGRGDLKLAQSGR